VQSSGKRSCAAAAQSEGKSLVKVIFDVKGDIFGVGGERVWGSGPSLTPKTSLRLPSSPSD